MTLNLKALHFLASTFVGACLTFAAGHLAAQEWPVKPIRFIVPVPPGTGPDVDIRQIGRHLSTLLGQPIVIENRPGAASRIGVEAAIKSAPDGYTFLVGTPSLTTMGALYPKLGFDPKRDLVPVSLASVTNYTLTVNAQVPAKTLNEFVALAKTDPKYASVGTLGMGAINHLAAAWFCGLNGIEGNYVHYSTSSPFSDLASGQIPAIFDAMLPVLGQVKAGRVRVLALSGKSRHPLMPDVPTFAEAGYGGFDPLVWIGVLAPAGTPAAIVNKMSAAISQVAKMPETVAARRDVGSESLGTSAEEFAAFLEAERNKWGAVIKKTGLVLE
jgi:tripartite-type tricarboxylate transporter receptor subunit TctC